jgi:4-cresol dehydrogenase (hydroxylating)
MSSVLPPKTSPMLFQRALAAFARVVGKEWVLTTGEDRETYMDYFAPGDADAHVPSAAVAPQSVEEVQALVRIANERKIPLWPIGRGKNVGYGGAAPRLSGTVVLDLGRMNRILEVNERFAYCLLEPGVTFFDLFNYLEENNIPLWMSMPGMALGSVLGNALERGFGYTPYGDNTAHICGMEVVLPNGDLVRTGMGAKTDGPSWQLYRYGYGPCWDQLFVQSNFGVVTKMGLHLMPEPESTLMLRMEIPNAEDIGWLIDTIAPLRLRGVIQHSPSIGCFLRSAAVLSQRKDWYQGKDALPEDVQKMIMEKLGLGWWTLNITMYGYDKINEANSEIIKAAMASHTKQEFTARKWHRGDAAEIARTGSSQQSSGKPAPTGRSMQLLNWYGGRGGNMAFSPVIPPRGDLALKQMRQCRRRFKEFEIDYVGTFTVGERHINNINMLVYDSEDAEMTRRVRGLFHALIQDAAGDGYTEYRTHLSYMDEVARTFDFNSHALMRLNETIKDALDPNGILAPGKQGIWPRALRGKKL